MKELKAQDLRVDNWVVFEPDGGEFIVSSIDVHNEPNTINGLNIDDLKPIPLTEDILLKCGFINKGSLYCLMVNDRIIGIGYDGSFGLYNGEHAFSVGSSFNNNHRIKHLHQLQNLFFALTGEELNVKL